MRKIFFVILLLVQIPILYCQDNDDKIFYVIDSIPIIDEPEEEDANLDNSDIDHINVITNKEELNKIGYSNYDKVIFIYTKEYITRADSLKKIPSTKIMQRKSGIWYLNSQPYSGKFITYFMNGRINAEGYMINGLLDGYQIRYRKNGTKSIESNYSNGKLNGNYKEYHFNGALKQEGVFENGNEVGKWIDYYSTGEIKRSNIYKNGKVDVSNIERKFYDLLDDGINNYFKKEDYKGAIKKYNKAIAINPMYSDAYFYRGTAKLYSFDFDGAKLDFDTAIIIEPLYVEAIANRAFSLIRKYEFKDSRTLNKSDEVTIMATKNDIVIPTDDLDKICLDLNKAVELGDNIDMIRIAIEKYCNKK